jgi:hypothetical protein
MHQELCLLGYNAVQPVEKQPTFRKNMSPSSGKTRITKDVGRREDEGVTGPIAATKCKEGTPEPMWQTLLREVMSMIKTLGCVAKGGTPPNYRCGNLKSHLATS